VAACERAPRTPDCHHFIEIDELTNWQQAE